MTRNISNLHRLLLDALVAVLLLTGVLIIGPLTVSSSSMASTISEGDVVVGSRVKSITRRLPWIHLFPLRRGDLVLFKMPGENTLLLKRVVAFPGDRVRLANGILMVNEHFVDEPYLAKPARSSPAGNWPIDMTGDIRSVLIPEEHCFVLGDNRAESVDSRMWGSISLSQVVGTVVCILRRRD